MKTWIDKLQIECIDEEDGSLTIHIEWDGADPELDYWTSLGADSQRQLVKQFVIDALTAAVECYVD